MATDVDRAKLLTDSQLRVHGRLVDSSNNALVVELETSGELAVYKPAMGEAPLWDFPDATLAKREVAAYELARALDWEVVPVTVWREDGPAGPGMCQSFIDSVPADDYVDLFAPKDVPLGWRAILQARDQHDNPVVLAHSDSHALRRLAVFDVIANNADRKGGHLLVSQPDDDSKLWAIDHGLTFHLEPKLRTVLWGFVGDSLPDWLKGDLTHFVEHFPEHAVRLRPFLSQEEVDGTLDRAQRLLTLGAFPGPEGGGPAVPWPVF